MLLDEKQLKVLREDSHTEFKESGRKIPDSLYETYSSFSNTSGGIIYLGIKEGKYNEISGLVNPEEQKKVLIFSLHSKNKVSYCGISDEDIEILDINNKKIIRFIVKEAPNEVKPVYLNGNLSKSYIRVGDGDFLMSEDEIATLLLKKKGVGFDMLPNILGLDETNLDEESIKRFRKNLNEINPNNMFSELNDHDFLLRIGALTKYNDKYVAKNGTILFFGYISDILQICPNYFLDYQENLTNNTRWDKRIVSDDFSFNANLYNFFDLVSKNIIYNLPNPFRVDIINNLNGSDIKRSVIEGIVNAITNCDFSISPGIFIKKTINEIIVTNSGDIPVGIDQAINGGITNPLNKSIMTYFRLLQLADHAGTGVPSIFHTFNTYGFITPSLKIEDNPKRTVLVMNFNSINKNAPYYDEKMKILSYLSSHIEGATTIELSQLISMKNTSTNQIITQLLQENKIKTNGKKTKGKRYYIA